MLNLTAADLELVLDYPSLIAAIKKAFLRTAVQPSRSHYTLPVSDRADATLLLMPAWDGDGYLGVKSATIFPSNGDYGLPAVMATYLLMNGMTGQGLAIIDGNSLTSMRTAATSALASSYLSRPSASTLLIIGAGALCLPLARAHSQVRPIGKIEIWNRSEGRAIEKMCQLRQEGFDARLARDLESSIRSADVVSCATLSQTPLVPGSWISPGTHLDLIGAYHPMMRESDAQAIEQADVYVDTRAGAVKEAGDLIRAQAESTWTMTDIRGDLHDLVRSEHPVSRTDDTRTVFKSVGVAIEDLAGAVLAYERSISADTNT